MAYFPIFVEMEQQHVLIVGGGRTAAQKVKALLPYGAYITVASPDFCDAIKAETGIRRLSTRFSNSLLQGVQMVIAATNDPSVNHTVSEQCRELHIPCNVVDNAAECSFLFPALVREGDLSIGISTSGASPSAAVWMKSRIRSLIPENMGAILSFLRNSRGDAKLRFSDEKTRAKFYTWLLNECLQDRIIPESSSLSEAIERFKQEGTL